MFLRNGISVGHQLIYNRLELVTFAGVLLLQQSKAGDHFYTRIGLRYYVTDHIFLNLTLKAFGFKAQYINYRNWIFVQKKKRLFCKRFKCPQQTMECSRILKGTDLSSNNNFTDQKIVIQVDFEKNYMDFSDFPDHKNVNANLLTSNLLKEPYVFTFNLDKTSSITIESIEEISSLDEYC